MMAGFLRFNVSLRPLATAAVLAFTALGIDFLASGVDTGSRSRFWTLVANLPELLAAGAVALATSWLLTLIVAHLRREPVPKLMRQLIGFLCWMVALIFVAGDMLTVPLGSLVTTSGMLVAVVGISLKNMISDLFNGLSMPVKVGDWIELDGKLGEVVEVSWHETRVLLEEDVMVIVPNSYLVSKPIRNLSQPHPYFRDRVKITLPQEATAYQVERNLIAAARQVDAIAAMPKKPDVRISGYNEQGVEWELRYFVPNAEAASRLRYRVNRNILRNLHYSNLSLPRHLIEMRTSPLPAVDSHESEELAFLGCVDLFNALTDHELETISSTMRRRLARAGEAVVLQGAVGDSLYIAREGLLSVTIATDGIDTDVGQIVPGQFFGEMSLLTGAPRAATVRPVVDSILYEITRDILEPVMQGRPEIAALMGDVLATRQLANQEKTKSRAELDQAKSSIVKQLIGKISAFFRLDPVKAASPRQATA